MITVQYTAGNYEAFARSRKPKDIDHKTAHIVGGGLAGLAVAGFLIRDGHMDGSKITIYEKSMIAGGALDGIEEPDKGFVIRGGREMENHFETLWDLFRSVPSLEIEDASVLDEFYWLNKDDPNYSLCRATYQQGKEWPTNGKFTLSKKAQKELMSLFLRDADSLQDVRINEVFSDEFLKSNFWMYWRTMFAFEEWHSALEMKLYLHRFVHHIDGLPDFSALKFTKYNQYESLTLPLVKWLQDHGVQFSYDSEVTDIDFEDNRPQGIKRATAIHVIREGKEENIPLTDNDLLFITIGSLVDNSDEGDHHTAAQLNEGPAPAWDLWKKIAKKDPAFGKPEVFCSNIEETKWESATVTTLDERIPRYIEQISHRNPLSGRVVTGGIVTAQDSSWLMSWTVNRQPHFKKQPKDQVVVWVYGLFSDVPGDYVKKSLQECTGEEIVQEWLYHLGVPTDEIEELAATGAKCVPVMMPYVTSFFMPRKHTDRPAVVPEGSQNFAFIGQFAQSATRDCIFTTEYSVRTAMESVYALLGIERGIPEVYNSTYDVRVLLDAAHSLADGEQTKLPGGALSNLLIDKKLKNTEILKLLKEADLL